jgi:hypothetical protein
MRSFSVSVTMSKIVLVVSVAQLLLYAFVQCDHFAVNRVEVFGSDTSFLEKNEKI